MTATLNTLSGRHWQHSLNWVNDNPKESTETYLLELTLLIQGVIHLFYNLKDFDKVDSLDNPL